MKSYIFACNSDTMGECLSRSLFGVGKPNVSDISVGDLCYLYNYSDKCLYGIWQATSKCGWHEKDAWDGKYKFQTRVERISKSLQKVLLHRVAPLIERKGEIEWKLFDAQAQRLLDYFAHHYDYVTTKGQILNEIEEDYRNRYPAKFITEDGHRVRSLSEQAIDNWLFRNGIPHAYEPIIPIPQQIIPDFMVKDNDGKIVYIEFWGTPDEPAYKERMYRKSQVYAANNFLLIELHPKDLQSLDYVLPKKLRQKNVDF